MIGTRLTYGMSFNLRTIVHMGECALSRCFSMAYFLFDYCTFLLLTSETMICENLTENVSVICVKCFAIRTSYIVKLTDHFITFN